MVIFVLTHPFTMNLVNQWQINLATGWTLPNTSHNHTNSFNGFELSNPYVLGFWQKWTQ